MDKDFGITSVFGTFLLVMAFIFFFCYILINDVTTAYFAISFGVVGTVFYFLSGKIDMEKLIITFMLFAIAGAVPMIINIKNITMAVVIVCGFFGIYFVLKPPDTKKDKDISSTQ
jgi:TctA family transporter